MNRLLGALAVALATAVAGAAPAQAATVSVGSFGVTYTAGLGESNDVFIGGRQGDSGVEVRVSDRGAAIDPGPGCRADGPKAAICEVNDDVYLVDADLGDLRDRLRFPSLLTVREGSSLFDSDPVAATVFGGEGNDVVEASSTPYLDVYGGFGDDRITAELLSGTVIAGPGNDRVKLPAFGPAGSPFGGSVDVEGGDGSDVLTGGGYVRGGEGADAIRLATIAYGGGGNDVIEGPFGDGEDGDDRLVAQREYLGTLQGSELRGGPGSDLLTGWTAPDALIAGTGDDRIQAFDGSEDRIECEDGFDSVTSDPFDNPGEDCERQRGPI